MKANRLVICALILSLGVSPLWAGEGEARSAAGLSGKLLILGEVLDTVERGHPLLQRSQTQKTIAAGKLLKALGAFEPKLVNEWELDQRIRADKIQNVGYNDTLVEMSHPSGVKGFAGYRMGIGDVSSVGATSINKSDQVLMGIAFPMLRGLIDNPANAQLKKSEMAQKQADLEIRQTRQDLYLGAAVQYWNWVAAWKLVELQEQTVVVAEERLSQLARQAKTGARAMFDVTEAEQEVQRRKEKLIAARRKVEQEQFKLALFLWRKEEPVVPDRFRAPDFPPLADGEEAFKNFERDRRTAPDKRPEVQIVLLEAKMNGIDLDVAENTLLPTLNATAEPSRHPRDYVLGLGYQFGVLFEFPFLQRSAKGDILQIKGEGERLKLLQRYRTQQVALDVENAKSAITRAHERSLLSKQAMELARDLEKGERTRFKLGSTSLLFVNLRERNAIRAAEEWIEALAEYQKSLSLYQWASGNWGVEKTAMAQDEKIRK